MKRVTLILRVILILCVGLLLDATLWFVTYPQRKELAWLGVHMSLPAPVAVALPEALYLTGHSISGFTHPFIHNPVFVLALVGGFVLALVGGAAAGYIAAEIVVRRRGPET